MDTIAGSLQTVPTHPIVIKLGIPYETFDDVDKMVEMGFTTMPMLKVDDKIMNYMEAVKWIKGGCKI